MLWLTLAFIPWITRWIWTGWRAGGLLPQLVPFLAALLLFTYHLASNKPSLFESGTVIYLGLSLVLHFSKADLYLNNAVFFDNLFLGTLWLSSLLNPFCLTAEYSRLNLPKASWSTRAFLETNRVPTWAWGLYFMACIVFGFFNAAIPNISWIILRYSLLVLMNIFSMIFQRWYPQQLMRTV